MRSSAEPERADLKDAVVEAERCLAEAEQCRLRRLPRKRFAANITDPESRMMKTQTGWVQGSTSRSR